MDTLAAMGDFFRRADLRKTNKRSQCTNEED
jgi:hypothetical protein